MISNVRILYLVSGTASLRDLVRDNNRGSFDFLECCCLDKKYRVDAAVHFAIVLDGSGPG